MQPHLAPWPYPRWIAHRGAGTLAPENTLAAFRLGAAYGYRMFECDVKLSRDDVAFLLHDSDLHRTTNACEVLTTPHSTLAAEHTWGTLAQLDAGSWHARSFAGEPLPTLQNIAAFCLRNHLHLNIEIKPCPGVQGHTGMLVAQQAAQLWQKSAVPPLLSSFDMEALRAAQAAQPALPRGLLLDSLWPGWLEAALDLQCVAVIGNYTLWDKTSVQHAQQAGLRTVSYTVNDEASAQRLIDLGTDGIITDRIDRFSPA